MTLGYERARASSQVSFVTLWRRDPVPKDFAKDLIAIPAHHTDVLGAGGLMPFLASENSGYMVMQVCGQWAGDRWAIWQFSDGSTGLLLETRWQDEKSALVHGHREKDQVRVLPGDDVGGVRVVVGRRA